MAASAFALFANDSAGQTLRSEGKGDGRECGECVIHTSFKGEGVGTMESTRQVEQSCAR